MVAAVPPLRGRRAKLRRGGKAGRCGRDDNSRKSEEKSGTLAALDRKNPPFANFAKSGAPSSSVGGRSNEEHRQECLCHKSDRAALFGGPVGGFVVAGRCELMRLTAVG